MFIEFQKMLKLLSALITFDDSEDFCAGGGAVLTDFAAGLAGYGSKQASAALGCKLGAELAGVQNAQETKT
ncbi:MAG: hypothetical protein RSE32_04965 [Comamonas sp.]|uniref:hypothetical protein n=1 Tax=Comamonas sp. TaxID=34028 RepID=UPI002FC9E375